MVKKQNSPQRPECGAQVPSTTLQLWEASRWHVGEGLKHPLHVTTTQDAPEERQGWDGKGTQGAFSLSAVGPDGGMR